MWRIFFRKTQFLYSGAGTFGGDGIGTVQRELARMTAAGLINQTQQGNQRHYQVNSACPVFDELRSTALKAFGVADVLKEALLPCVDKIQIAFICGSIVKGEVTVSSDVDVMVVGEGISYAGLMEKLTFAEVCLGRSISPVVYDVSEFSRKLGEGNVFLRRALQQPKIVLIGSTDGFEEP